MKKRKSKRRIKVKRRRIVYRSKHNTYLDPIPTGGFKNSWVWKYKLNPPIKITKKNIDKVARATTDKMFKNIGKRRKYSLSLYWKLFSKAFEEGHTTNVSLKVAHEESKEKFFKYWKEDFAEKVSFLLGGYGKKAVTLYLFESSAYIQTETKTKRVKGYRARKKKTRKVVRAKKRKSKKIQNRNIRRRSK